MTNQANNNESCEFYKQSTGECLCKNLKYNEQPKTNFCDSVQNNNCNYKQLLQSKTENKKLKQEIKIIGELLNTEAFVSNISYKIGRLKGKIARLQGALEKIIKGESLYDYCTGSCSAKHKDTSMCCQQCIAKNALEVKDEF